MLIRKISAILFQTDFEVPNKNYTPHRFTLQRNKNVGKYVVGYLSQLCRTIEILSVLLMAVWKNM